MSSEPTSARIEHVNAVLALWRRARQSPLVANTISYTINFGLQLVIQLGFFMLVSRTLGAQGYGVFVSITSVSIIAALHDRPGKRISPGATGRGRSEVVSDLFRPLVWS